MRRRLYYLKIKYILCFPMIMDLIQCIHNVQVSLSENGFTIPTFLHTILVIQHADHAPLCETLLFEAETICSDLLRHSTSDSVFLWAFATLKNKLCQVVALTHLQCRLHFNASKTTSEYLEGSFIQTVAQKIEETAPYLWSLVTGLLDANPAC
jgi:hypothetical protein